jgi:ribosomal-protein-alanine N-acetyltransferase
VSWSQAAGKFPGCDRSAPGPIRERPKEAALGDLEVPARSHAAGRGGCAEALSARRVRGAAWDRPAVGTLEMRTKRLRLARPVPTDSAAVFAILGDPRTVEHKPSDRLEDRGEAAELVARWVRHWEEHGFGYWCVRESGSDRIIGHAGVKWMLMPRPVLNLVYRFVPEMWGRGIATEAAAAVVSKALEKIPAETIVARVRPDNRPSQNVALKAGLQRDATMDCQGEDGLDWAFTNRKIQ